MPLGNNIVITEGPQGRGARKQVIVSGTPKPGTIMTPKPGAADVQGRPVYEPAGVTAGLMTADGSRIPIAVLDADWKGGRTNADAYEDGEVAEVYFPVEGDELNCRKANESGTADDTVINTTLMIVDDGTGLLLVTTGSPESEPFLARETITDPTAEQLMRVQYIGR